MQIEQRTVGAIHPYAGNPRSIPQAAIDKVAMSINAFGFRQPIVVDADGVIIVGHTRYLAARQLGLEEVPVHVAENLTSEQAAAYRLADNRTGDESTWDDSKLAAELQVLTEADLAELTGFDSTELDRILSAVDVNDLLEPEAADHADERVPSVFEIIITAESEAEQEMLFERFRQDGYRCRVLSS